MSAHSTYAMGDDSQTLQAWGGIVTGTIESWAEALDVAPSDVEAALDALDAEVLMDTAVPKKRDSGRPTSPNLRSVALSADGARKLAADLQSNPHAKDAE